MSKIKARIEDKEYEFSPDQLELPEGFKLVSPGNVPDGFYTNETVQKMIGDRLKNTKENTRSELEADKDFHKRIFSSYNISLDDEGKPKGLKPIKDVDEIRKEVTGEISGQYEEKLKQYQEKLSKRDEAVVESAILSAVNGHYKDELVKSFDGEKPLVVDKFRSRVGVDEDGRPYVKNEKGEKMFKGDGDMTVTDYLLDEKRFGELMKDKRQKGSGFGEGGTGDSAPSGPPMEWTLKQKLAYIEKHGKDGYEKKLRESKKR